MPMDSSFLTEKGIGGMPNWALGALGILGAIAYSTWRKNSAANAATNATVNPATTASQQPPNVFVVPGATTTTTTTGGDQTTPPPTGRPTIPTGSGDVINSSGRDLGQYLYGQDELNYITQNMGKFGFTSSLSADVKQAYSNVVAMYGADIANQYHYAYYAPKNVVAIPNPNANGLVQIQALG